MTKTVKFTANSTWQEAITGPKTATINVEQRFVDIYIGTTAPNANTTDIFLYKPVAGENYLDITLETGDKFYVKSHGEYNSVISWIEKTTP